MTSISDIIFFTLTFLSLYVQVFFLVTFLENRKKIVIRNGSIKLTKYPGVTVIVPCWNEEKTIYKTVRSLLNLNYPKDKVKIFLVDDGSTDKTWEVIKKFEKYSNIKIFHKENGGKHTALNLGLQYTETDFLGCLDADSFVDPEALVRIMSYFEKDPTVMAVAPSVISSKPKNIVQGAQEIEYNMSVYLKKMLACIGGIHVAPGPFSIFRKKVFNDLGPYRFAHNTEDMEIAYRMQKNNYKIEHCNDAYVYTNTPITILQLFKQRLRWIYGYINNTLDYKDVVLRKKYGNFSTFTLPSGILSVLAVSFIFGRMSYNLGNFLFSKIIQFQTIGFNFSPKFNFLDPFFINTKSVFFISIILYGLVIFSTMLGKKIIEGKWRFSLDTIYFLLIFGLVGPFWLLKAVYSTIISRKPDWR